MNIKYLLLSSALLSGISAVASDRPCQALHEDVTQNPNEQIVEAEVSVRSLDFDDLFKRYLKEKLHFLHKRYPNSDPSQDEFKTNPEWPHAEEEVFCNCHQSYRDATWEIWSKYRFKVDMLECTINSMKDPKCFYINRESTLEYLDDYIKNFWQRSRGYTVPNFDIRDERWIRKYWTDEERKRKNTDYYIETWQMLEKKCREAIADTTPQYKTELHPFSLRYCTDACYRFVEKIIELNEDASNE